MSAVARKSSKLLAIILALVTLVGALIVPVNAASLSKPSKPKVSVKVVGRVTWTDIRGWADKDATVTWDKVQGAEGYQIKYKINGSTRTEYSTKNSDVLSFGHCPYPLKLNYCTVQVRAYKHEGRRTVYSAWSSTKTFWV